MSRGQSSVERRALRKHVLVALGGVCAIVLLVALTRGEQTPSATKRLMTVDEALEYSRIVVTAIPTFPPVAATGWDDVTMVKVPAGEFIMGSTLQDVMRGEEMWVYARSAYNDHVRDEWPQMVVYLDEFEIDKYEVTYARYQNCVDAGVCASPRHAGESPDHPVLVTWEQAQAYCQWVDKRLPTEAEWEKAARGDDGRIYPWGNEWKPSYLKIYYENREFETTPAGRYPKGASPYGALDMAGNAPEWVSDQYRAYPGGRLAEKSIYADGPFVWRGGYHVNVVTLDPPELHYRVADRFPGDKQSQNGLRCVRGPEPPVLEESVVSVDILAQPAPVSDVDLTNMVEIPSGEFIMGSDSDPAYPLHMVYLDAFYIDRYETTNAEYVEFLNALGATYFACNGITCAELRPPEFYDDGSAFISRIIEQDGIFVVEAGYEDYAVASVTWDGANAYCRWRGKRLPTEAEWEKAARGTDGRIYSWGNERYLYERDLYKLARKPNPVGSHPEDVSPYGVWDVVGSVREWVSDWYDPDYYHHSPYRNPTGPEMPEGPYERIRRGGKLFSRRWDIPDFSRETGVRCAVTP
jgi:formylglycine-generating enzyme required for sulfatase activity